MEGQMLRRKQVEALTGLSRSTIYAEMKRGTFPKPVRLSRRAVAWRAKDITEWVSNLVS